MQRTANSAESTEERQTSLELTRWLQRFRKHRAFRVQLLMNVFLGAALCGEIAVLFYELPNHARLVLHVATWVMVVLLPFTVFGILARTPKGARKWPQRLVVRPFTALKTNPNLNGVAVASLLDRQIGYWLSDKFNKSDGAGSSSSPTLSLGWVSVPLDWLWNWLGGWITGRRDLFIDGMLIDDETGMFLQAWVSDSVSTLVERVNKGPLADNLNDAAAKLAFRILEELEPVTVAVFHSMRWRDDDAIRLLKGNENLTEEEKVLLAEAYLNAERLSAAGASIEDLRCFIKDGAERLDVERMRASLRVKQGSFSEAREVLEGILGSKSCEAARRCEVKRLIAEVFAQEYRLEDALGGYDRVVEAFFEESGTLLGSKWQPGESMEVIGAALRKAAAEMTNESKRNSLGEILMTLRQSLGDRARCSMLLALAVPDKATERRPEAIRDLQLAIQVHNLWTEFVSSDTAIRDSSAATLASTLAQVFFAEGDLDGAEDAVREAIRLYKQAPPYFEQDLHEDDQDMSAQASLAWCYFGRSAAWRLHTKLTLARKVSPEQGERFDGGIQEADGLGPEGLLSLAFVIHSLPAEERQQVDQLYDNAMQREPGPVRNMRLWKTAETVAAWMIGEEGASVVKFAAAAAPTAARSPEEFEQYAVDYVPLREAQTKADLDDGEVLSLVNTLASQLLHFTDRNTAEDKSELDQLWAGVESDVAGRQAGVQFSKLGNGSRRAKAESAYGRACLGATLGYEKDAADLLNEADDAAGEGTRAYRNRAVLDKDFDWVRLSPIFRQVTGWPLPEVEGSPALEKAS